MDNISKKSFKGTVTSISKYISVGIPLLIDFLGILTIFVGSLQDWLKANMNLGIGLIIVVILNILLVANIFVFVEKTAGKKADKVSYFITGYKKILRNHASCMVDFDARCKSINSVEELYRDTSAYLKEFVDEAKSVLSKATGEKIRVCIKVFPEKYSHRDTFAMELMTFCRSDKTLQESAIERRERIPVHKNTDFKMIMVEAYPYFAFNDLRNFKRVTKMEYENTTEHWESKYLSTIVSPIGKCISTYKGKQSFEVLGFLCVDTLALHAFSGDAAILCLEFVESLSNLLCVFLDKCIEYREILENNSRENI